MNFPYYETPIDRTAEWRICEALAEAWGFYFCKIPTGYRLDFALHNEGSDHIEALIEAKRRYINFGYGNGLKISSGKIKTGLEFWERFGSPAYFVGEFDDGSIWVTRFDQYKEGLIIWGRSDKSDDRGSKTDKYGEPCLVFPWDEFERIV